MKTGISLESKLEATGAGLLTVISGACAQQETVEPEVQYENESPQESSPAHETPVTQSYETEEQTEQDSDAFEQLDAVREIGTETEQISTQEPPQSQRPTAEEYAAEHNTIERFNMIIYRDNDVSAAYRHIMNTGEKSETWWSGGGIHDRVDVERSTLTLYCETEATLMEGRVTVQTGRTPWCTVIAAYDIVKGPRLEVKLNENARTNPYILRFTDGAVYGGQDEMDGQVDSAWQVEYGSSSPWLKPFAQEIYDHAIAEILRQAEE